LRLKSGFLKKWKDCQDDAEATIQVSGPPTELLRVVAETPHAFLEPIWDVANSIIGPQSTQSPHSISTNIGFLPESSKDWGWALLQIRVEDALTKAFCFVLDKYGLRTSLNVNKEERGTTGMGIAFTGDKEQVKLAQERFMFGVGGPKAPGLRFEQSSVSGPQVVEVDKQRGLADRTTLEIAKKYGGILSSPLLVYESAIPFETAESELERLVGFGVAFKRFSGNSQFYDIPDARTHLAHSDRQIVEVLAIFEGELTKTELVRRLGFPLEVMAESLKRLEQEGIITYSLRNRSYQLRGLTTKRRNRSREQSG
jgi:hypothetical protein